MANSQYSEVELIINPHLTDYQQIPTLFYDRADPSRGLVTVGRDYITTNITRRQSIEYRGDLMRVFQNLIAIPVIEGTHICIGNDLNSLGIADIIAKNSSVFLQLSLLKLRQEAQNYVETFMRRQGIIREALYRSNFYEDAVQYHIECELKRGQSCVELTHGLTYFVGHHTDADIEVRDNGVSPAHLAVALIGLPEGNNPQHNFVVIHEISGKPDTRIY